MRVLYTLFEIKYFIRESFINFRSKYGIYNLTTYTREIYDIFFIFMACITAGILYTQTAFQHEVCQSLLSFKTLARILQRLHIPISALCFCIISSTLTSMLTGSPQIRS